MGMELTAHRPQVTLKLVRAARHVLLAAQAMHHAGHYKQRTAVQQARSWSLFPGVWRCLLTAHSSACKALRRLEQVCLDRHWAACRATFVASTLYLSLSPLAICSQCNMMQATAPSTCSGITILLKVLTSCMHCYAGLLPGGLSSLTPLLSDSAYEELLPAACAWVLLLALHLLCELRDPHSRQVPG